MSGFNKAFTPSPDLNIMINIGCLFDIPTGFYVTGSMNESLLNAGFAYLTGIIGIGNIGKSTIMRWMHLTAMSRVPGSEGGTYETEISLHKARVQDIASHIPEFNGEDVIYTERWVISDKRNYSGNEWFEVEQEQLKIKIKDKKGYEIETPFMNYKRTEHFKMLRPTFREVDSFTELSTDNIDAKQEEVGLGEKGAEMIFMHQGIAKTRMLQQLPALLGNANHYMSLSAHLGKAFNLDPRAAVRKQLQHIPQDFKIKGVPEKFTFGMNNAWLCFSSSVLKNDTTKAPEYPRSSEDDLKGDTDLNIVNVIQSRGKSGPTGMPIQVVISQQEGVLPSLTEFHYIKESDRFGLEGNDRNYVLIMRPDVTLSRTSVRRKIDTDPMLRAALHYTSELCQMHDLWHHLRPSGILCTPKELYDGLKAKGYDWEVLLNTRPWVGLDRNHKYEKEYLSTMCLLRMRLPDDHPQAYHPYWMAPKVDGKVVSNAIIDWRK